jgi:hypothetical protein
MTDLRFDPPDQPGWSTVSVSGLHVVVRGGGALVDRVRTAAADGDVDAVLDVLAGGGLRATPDFVVVGEGDPVRVVVRGEGYAVVSGPEGETQVRGPRRGSWTDVDAPEGVTAVAVVLPGAHEQSGADQPAGPESDQQQPVAEPPQEGEPEQVEQVEQPGTVAEDPAPVAPPEPEPQPEPTSQPQSEPQPQPEPERAAPAEPTVTEPVAEPSAAAVPAPSTHAPEATVHPPPEVDEAPAPAPSGWRPPNLLRRRTDPAPAAPPAAPVPESVQPEQPVAPEQTQAPAAQQQPAPPAPSPSPSASEEEVDELPSYDHLFGATQQDRPAYIEQHDTGTIDEPPIGHAPIESAGGYTSQEPKPGDRTLAPPAQPQSPAPQPPPGQPSAAPAPPPPAPAQGGRIIDSVPWSSGGSNVPAPEPKPAPPATPAGGTHTPPPAPSLRQAPPPARPPASPSQSVPPAPPAPAPQPAAPQSPPQHAAPPPAVQPPAQPATPPAAAAPASPAGPAAAGAADASGDDAEATVDRSALLGGGPSASGPLVLAVLCPAGHASPPHSSACRVCGRDIPPQQPFQTPRPSLGVLRLPTGDVVMLDRGVLLGRSPKVNADLDAGMRPHLVRVPSPENDISRNHVEIVLEGWHVLIRDLGSTNGTTVTLPGQLPVRLRPSDQQVLEPGTVITLADEVAITFEVAAS